MAERLIDATLIIRALQDEEYYGADMEYPILLLQNAQTIDARPIIHAHWNDDGRCTNCGGHAPFFAWTDEWFRTKFCPHCGAQIHKSISCNHEDDNHIAEDGKKGIKIPVISMEDVPKIMEEKE